MKKLKLKAIEFGDREMLTREQMKKVLGGNQPSGYYRCCYYVGCETDRSFFDCILYINPPDGLTCNVNGGTYPITPCT